MIKVRDWDLLDLKHVIRIKNRLKVWRRQKLVLELIERVVVWILLVELLALDGLQHFQDGGFWIGWLVVENVCHQLLHEKVMHAVSNCYHSRSRIQA